MDKNNLKDIFLLPLKSIVTIVANLFKCQLVPSESYDKMIYQLGMQKKSIAQLNNDKNDLASFKDNIIFLISKNLKKTHFLKKYGHYNFTITKNQKDGSMVFCEIQSSNNYDRDSFTLLVYELASGNVGAQINMDYYYASKKIKILDVPPRIPSQGYGSTALDFLLNFAIENGAREVYNDFVFSDQNQIDRLKKFYEKHNFKIKMSHEGLAGTVIWENPYL